MLEEYPWCIYCGAKADSVEHMPPIKMFRQRHRPKGLEFPACEGCNAGTRLTDLAASFLGRMYPDPPDQLSKEETSAMFEGIKNNVPGLLEEMFIPPTQWQPNVSPDGVQMRANGPILAHHMQVFGAKLGFALHFEAHRERVPDNGGVQSRYYTNVNARRGELPTVMLSLLPKPATLQQGRFQVRDQFQYSWALTEERRHSAFYAVFNDSFAILVATAVDRSEFLAKYAEIFPVWVPGDLKKLK